MGILGNTRLNEEDINYILLGAPAGADSAFTLSLINTTSISAKATVMLLSRFSAEVRKIDIVSGGKFSAIPGISISGGKTADATVTELSLAAFIIDSPGTGYAVGDILTLPAGIGTGTAGELKVKRVGVSGAVVDAEVHDGGTYTALGSSPTYTVPGTTGTGLIISAPLFAIKTITMVNTGNDYDFIPVVTTSWEAGAVLKAVLAVKTAESSIIEPLIDLPAAGVYERSGLIISDGEAIAVSTNVQDAVNAAAWGFTS